MIDFNKLDITHIPQNELLTNPHILWQQGFNPTTGEISNYPIRGKLFNCKIVITDNQKVFSGSLHILKNLINSNDRQNYDDFNFDDLSYIIDWLSSNLGLEPNKTTIQNLEYGVNVLIWKDPTDLINENVIVWNNRVQSKNFTFDNKGKFIEWVLGQYSQKLYNKGDQHKLDSHILRWEKKAIKSQYLQKLGIKVLSDLLIKENLLQLKNDLVESFDKLILVDSLTPDINFATKDLKIWNKGTNPKTWENLKTKHRSQRSRLKKDFRKLLKENELNTYHRKLKERIETKGNELIECNLFTDLETPSPKEVNATFLHLDNIEKRCTPETINILCGPVTKKYKKRDIKTIPLLDQPKYKKIRNSKSNPRNNLKSQNLKVWYNRQLSLFLDYPLDLSKVEFELLNYWKGTKHDILKFISYQVKTNSKIELK